jgi:hypothetical protein
VSHHCLAPEELESVRVLSPEDPRRREAEACPRCRGLLVSYDEFLEDRSVPPGVDPERAAPQLRDAFERALGEARGPARAARPARATERKMRPWWAALLGPRLAWGAAVAIVAVAGLYAGAHWRPLARDEEVLRTAPDSSEARGQDRPVLLEPRAVAVGLELRWRSTPGADAYRVVFLGEDLAQLASLGPAPDTVAVLVAAHLPSGLLPGRTVAWQVEALQGGYVIKASGTALLTLP